MSKFINRKPQKYLGPSQFASALGLNKFKSAEELKNQLENGYRQEITNTMQAGHNYEKTVMKKYWNWLKEKDNRQGKMIYQAKWGEHPIYHRLGGFADGILVDSQGQKYGLLEIKTHTGRSSVLTSIPEYYLVQVAGYLAIYGLEYCDFVSCCVNSETGEPEDMNVIPVTWDQVKEKWENDWLPKLIDFVDSVEWKR